MQGTIIIQVSFMLICTIIPGYCSGTARQIEPQSLGLVTQDTVTNLTIRPGEMVHLNCKVFESVGLNRNNKPLTHCPMDLCDPAFPHVLNRENGTMTFHITENETSVYQCTNRVGRQIFNIFVVADCGPLTINNGVVTLSNRATTLHETATYSCDTGYLLSGEAVRTCEASGSWSMSAPICVIHDCGPLEIINGDVTFSNGLTTFNEIATYTCKTGYDLSGSATRTCEASGNWSLSAPTSLSETKGVGTAVGIALLGVLIVKDITVAAILHFLTKKTIAVKNGVLKFLLVLNYLPVNFITLLCCMLWCKDAKDNVQEIWKWIRGDDLHAEKAVKALPSFHYVVLIVQGIIWLISMVIRGDEESMNGPESNGVNGHGPGPMESRDADTPLMDIEANGNDGKVRGGKEASDRRRFYYDQSVAENKADRDKSQEKRSGVFKSAV